MDAIKILDNFTQALNRAGMAPRDIAPILGIHLSSLYRILAGRTSTTKHTLRTLEMATVFLRWTAGRDILGDPPETAVLYEKWVNG